MRNLPLFGNQLFRFTHRGEINAELGNTTWGEGGVELIFLRTRLQVNKKVPAYIRFFGVFGVGSDFVVIFGVGSDIFGVFGVGSDLLFFLLGF